MKRFVIVFLIVAFLGCTSDGVFSRSDEDQGERYSTTAITLSDFSMKITAYYQKQGLSVPGDFNETQFFALLESIYPDQSRVQAVRDEYRISVRSLNGGYSVILCDMEEDRKIMEDFSCHLNRVELLSWKSDVATPCVFEGNWEPLCK
ncbi:MAG TPA: hypothetical protein PLR60_05190 [Syntrophorhabdaceae bacterium]|nr:hypothetical protein [Syntrophorhabdaceae bacterium]